MNALQWKDSEYRAQKRRKSLLRAVVAAIIMLSSNSSSCVRRNRLNWSVHKQTLLLEGEFARCYRMDVISFEKLLLLIRPALLRDEVQSSRRTGTDPITPENMLQMTISWLAGSNYHTTRCLAGTSSSGFDDSVKCVMDALCDCQQLRLWSPTESTDRVQMIADGFTSISMNDILTGCVGCLDGWLCRIRAPSKAEVPDVSAFFSGHYQVYGLNVQATCDWLCRFTGYCFDSPGKVGDSIAFKKWSLSDEIIALPSGFYFIGDNAYPLSDSLLVPYNKLELKERKHSGFNFFISQLRIRIEMAFGLLVNKWQIFKRPLVVDFKTVTTVIKTCIKLHNYCIDERIQDADTDTSPSVVSATYNSLPESSFLPTDNNEEESDVELCRDARGRILRQLITDHIQEFNLRRPHVH